MWLILRTGQSFKLNLFSFMFKDLVYEIRLILNFNVSFTTQKFDQAFLSIRKWMYLIGCKSSQITFCVIASFSFIPVSQATSLFWE